MYFKRTYFTGFRNLEAEAVDWSQGLNLITGANGSGKTNLIEGLHLISGWGPLEKGTRVAALPSWGESRGKAQLSALVAGEREARLQLSVSTRCALRWDQQPIKASELRAQLPVLTFLPGHLSIVNGSASHRRALLDVLGALLYPVYARQLNDYRKIVRHRVVLLRRGCSVAATDALYRSVGSWIWEAREKIVQGLSKRLLGYERLLPGKVSLSFVRGGCLHGEDFAAALQRSRSREWASKIPQVGAHRDDLCIESEGRVAKDFFSRGQGRRVAIALILASATLVERVLGRKPILLLDEVTAELDKGGKQLLLSVLSEGGNQVFAASAELEEDLPYPGYTLSEGRVLQKAVGR